MVFIAQDALREGLRLIQKVRQVQYETVKQQVGVYPAAEPFGRKIRSALRRAGIQWSCLHDLMDAPESLTLLIINVPALQGGEDALKAVLHAKLHSPLRSVPTILLDPPDAEVVRGWADGYEARISLALSPAQMAQVIQRVLSQRQPTGTPR